MEGNFHRVDACRKAAHRPAARKRHFGKNACGKGGRERLGRDPPCPRALHFHRVLDKDVRGINDVLGDVHLDEGDAAARLHHDVDRAVHMGGEAARERIDRRDVVFARERLRLFWGAPEGTLVSVVELPRHREIGGEDIEGRVEIDGRGLGKRRLDGSERRRDDIDKKARLHAFAARARRREDDLVTAHRESVDAFGKGELRRDLGSGVFRPLGVRARDREPRKQRFELRRREDAFGGREGGAHRRERAQNEGIGAARRRDLIGGGIGEKARSRARRKDAALRRGDAHLARERVYQDALSGGEIEVARLAARGVARDARSARKRRAARGIHAAAVARGGVIGDPAARHRKGRAAREIHAAAVAARRVPRDGAARHRERCAVGDIDRRAVLRAVGGEIAARQKESAIPLHADAAAHEFAAAAAARIGQS